MKWYEYPVLYYYCPMSLSDCRDILVNAKDDIHEDYYAINYEFKKLSYTQLHLIYKGMVRFYGNRKTEFLVNLNGCEKGTIMKVDFKDELWHMPPLTYPKEIDVLLFRLVQAKRLRTAYDKSGMW